MQKENGMIGIFCDLDGTLLQAPPSYGSLVKMLIQRIRNRKQPTTVHVSSLTDEIGHRLQSGYPESSLQEKLPETLTVRQRMHRDRSRIAGVHSLNELRDSSNNNLNIELAAISGRESDQLLDLTAYELKKKLLITFFKNEDSSAYRLWLRETGFSSSDWKLAVIHFFLEQNTYEQIVLLENDLRTALIIAEYAAQEKLPIHVFLRETLETNSWILKLLGKSKEELSKTLHLFSDFNTVNKRIVSILSDFKKTA